MPLYHQTHKITNPILKYLGILAILLLSFSAFSQDQLVSLKTGYIYDSKKDNLGRIWFATSSGLVLHDGANNIKIGTKIYEFDGQEILKLSLFKDGLYVIYKDHGCFKFNLNNLVATKITNKKVISVVQPNEHVFYVLYSSGVLEKNEKGKIEKIRKFDDDLDNSSVMFEGPKNTLLVSISFVGLYQINAQSGVTIKDYGIKPVGYLNMFTRLENRFFYINNLQVLELDNANNFVKSSILNEKENKDISTIDILSAHSILYVKNRKSVYLFNNDKTLSIGTPKNKTYEIWNTLLSDTNNLYIGTNQGLVKVINSNRTTNQVFDSIANSSNLPRVRRKIITLKNKELLFLGYPNSYIYNNVTQNFKAILKKPNPLYDGLVIGDFLWASSEGGGLFKVNINNGQTDSIIAKGIEPRKLYLSVTDIGSVINNSIAFGTRGKLIIYNYKLNTVDSILLHDDKARIRSFALDTSSNLLFAGTEDGLYKINLSKKLVNKVNSLGKFITDIKLDFVNNQKFIWIASDFGIEQYDITTNKLVHKYPSQDFNNTKLTSILLDNNHNIWASSFSGIFSIDPVKNIIIKINNEKKLANLEFNYKSAAKLEDGKLMFGGLNGYDILDPKFYSYDHNKIKGKFTGYSIYSNSDTVFKFIKPNEKILFNTDNSFIRLYFTINNAEIIRYCTFEYSIDNSSWITIQDASSFILYKLTDGLHTIKIRGVDEVGNNINFAPILIDYYTNFFKSSTFIFLLLFFVVVLIWFIIIFRVKSYQNEKKIKDDIAMDLHDEVGTILTRTLHTLKNDPDKESPSKIIITNYVSEALFGIRAYINAINQNSVSIYQIEDEVKEFKNIFIKSSKIDYQLYFDIDHDYQVDSNVYREIKMLLYEINQNVIKHSNATEKTTYFWVKNGLLNVQTFDNGPLTNIDEIISKGNGINNIKKRVNRLNGAVDFLISDLGHGLQINIKVRI